eukprot:scaffold58078_cov65-Phaeocystis_antarctica.AAC.2
MHQAGWQTKPRPSRARAGAKALPRAQHTRRAADAAPRYGVTYVGVRPAPEGPTAYALIDYAPQLARLLGTSARHSNRSLHVESDACRGVEGHEAPVRRRAIGEAAYCGNRVALGRVGARQYPSPAENLRRAVVILPKPSTLGLSDTRKAARVQRHVFCNSLCNRL